jgi:hypothetical protein
MTQSDINPGGIAQCVMPRTHGPDQMVAASACQYISGGLRGEKGDPG